MTAADLPAAPPAPVSSAAPLAVRRGAPAVLLVALVLFPVVFTNGAVTTIGFYTVMYLIAACGWNIFSGYSGYISLGHAAYFGIGQYTVALIAVHLKVPGGWDQIALLPLAGLAAAAASVPIGYLLLRVRKYTFIILTIAVLAVLQLLALTSSWTSGSGGLALPLTLWQGNAFNQRFYYVALVVAAAAMMVSWQVRRSRFGLVLLAIRDDEDRAGGLGVRVTQSKIIAYALSAFFVGAAGAIYAPFQGTVYPQLAFDPTFDLALVVLIFVGGIGTLWGPVLGTLLLIPLQQYFELQFGNANLYLVAYGLLFILILRLLPAGIVPGLSQLWRWFLVTRSRAAELRAAGSAPRPASMTPAPAGPARPHARHGRLPAGRAEGTRFPAQRPEGTRLPPLRADAGPVRTELAEGNLLRAGTRPGLAGSANLLEVTGVSKAYGGIRALNGCSMTFAGGAINGLIGPNGSGKTTLFNVITGYETADSGHVRLRGRDITGASPSRVFGLGIGRTFQITRVFPRLSVLENMHVATQRPGIMAGARSPDSAAERSWALDVLDFVGLARLAGEPAGALSYGQQKLLEFASIIVAQPKVMLLDEPAGGVNPTLLRHLTGRIRELNSQGVTFVIVEHDMEFVMSLCDQVMVMNQGSALTGGTPAQVRSDPAVLEAYLGAGAYLGS